ncbi:N-terminal domain of galactosyltransferase [Popillia japonica]|uniref:N-terminal domain of galactosyltransferase n=1 Tax=Popillia japonica TaxID=7064 RepID=A0AAW1K026_POPJA
MRNREISVGDVFRMQHFEKPNLGGEYIQKHCLPYKKSAIIVPYRNRKHHLHTFLNYMHYFLQQQHISYRIFIVEQNDDYSFNRAKLLNVGALEAVNQNYTCLIFSDVDLLPLNTGNIYACSRLPRHMCSAIDIFRFNLPYEGLFGGVISIRSDQFKLVNGMSNEYLGWGGEDDDFYRRLKHHNITPYRFSPQVSKYTMLTHNKEKPSEDRFEKLERASDRQQIDGLTSLSYNHIVKLKSLYTHILVK